MSIENLLIGTAIGDAFGAGVEFQDRNWIRENVDFRRFVNVRNKIQVPADQLDLFTKNYRAWDYTDDTEMTIGLIHALVAKDPFTEELLIQKWEAEYNRGRKEKGFGRNGHGSMSWYFSSSKTMDEIRSFQRDRSNPGNAPAMRSVPLGLLPENQINGFAEINANATHPNLIAVLSSQCIARAATFILIENGNPKDLFEYCRQTISLNKEYKIYFDQVEELNAYEDLTIEGFKILCGAQPIKAPYFLPGIHGIPSDSKYTTGCVLYVLRECKNPFDALKKSIHLGGDVDSVAPITTGIMAAKMGLKSLPKFMLERVEGREYFTEVAMAFEKYLEVQ